LCGFNECYFHAKCAKFIRKGKRKDKLIKLSFAVFAILSDLCVKYFFILISIEKQNWFVLPIFGNICDEAKAFVMNTDIL